MIGKSLGWHVMWLVHTLRPKRNPLRRTRDRFAALTIVVLVLVGLIAVPVVAVIGSLIHDRQAEESVAAVATRRPVHAVLTQNAVIQAQSRDSEYPTSQPRADVRWKDSRDQARTVNVEVAPDATAGQTVPLWVDRADQVVPSPPTPDQVRTNVVIVALMLLSSVELVCIGLVMAVSHLSMTWAKPGWEREWSAVEPQWTR